MSNAPFTAILPATPPDKELRRQVSPPMLYRHNAPRLSTPMLPFCDPVSGMARMTGSVAMG
jgi:hypothetical protein